MFGLSELARWVFIFLGGALVLLGILEHKGMLNTYPNLEYAVFPYIWIIGLVLIFIGYGWPKESNKPSGNGGIDVAPGFGEKKTGFFDDGPFGGDGGGD